MCALKTLAECNILAIDKLTETVIRITAEKEVVIERLTREKEHAQAVAHCYAEQVKQLEARITAYEEAEASRGVERDITVEEWRENFK